MSRSFLFSSVSATLLSFSALHLYQAQKNNIVVESAVAALTDDRGLKAKFSFKTREQHIEEVETNPDFDVVIIGGGATGAGAVLDGAFKGLRCLLVENYDFASGTSSKSTKLIHGGVRYLSDVFALRAKTKRSENFQLVKEALQERSFMIDNAFYMNKHMPIILPCKGLFDLCYFYGGSLIYHLTYALFKNRETNVDFKLPSVMGKTQLQSEYPLLDPKYNWGVIYWDGVFNDARMAVDTVLTATIKDYLPGFKEANVLNYCRFDQFEKDQKGHIKGVVFTDKNTGKQHKVNCKVVLNCTGVFSDSIRKLDNPLAPERMTTSEGTHVILPRKYGSRKYGICAISSDGRVTFLMPWQNHVLYGTTDSKFDEKTMNPVPKAESLVFLMKQLNDLFPKTEISQISSDIKSKWTGLRPLVKSDDMLSGGTKAISRKHVIEETESGLISIMGGKWTIYRKMGEEGVNQGIQHMLKRGDLKSDSPIARAAKELSTHTVPLLGDYRSVVPGFKKSIPHYDFVRSLSERISEKYKLEGKTARHLVKTYGVRAVHLAEEISKDQELGKPIHPDHSYLKVEIKNAIENEMALTPVDILARRTRLLFVDAEAAKEAMPLVVKMFSKEKGLSEKEEEAQLAENLEVLEKMKF